MDKLTMGTLLFTIDATHECRIGMPPHDPRDSFKEHSKVLGTLTKYCSVFFNPKGELFVVRERELFKGAPPAKPWKNDWSNSAESVSVGEWNECNILCFRSDGILFAITLHGDLYKGPEPSISTMSWFYRAATKIGSGFGSVQAMCFDPHNIMYGVYNGELRRSPDHSTVDSSWLTQSIVVGRSGWNRVSLFLAFSSDGKLWCNIADALYFGDPPTDANVPWFESAIKIQFSDLQVPLVMFAFAEDNEIVKVWKLDFHIDLIKQLAKDPEIVTEQIYDNTDSTTTLKATFEVDQVLTSECEFGHEHGMTISQSVVTGRSIEIGFKIFDIGINPAFHRSTTDSSSETTTVRFDVKYKTETRFKIASNFEVAPGKAVRQMAVAKKAKIDVPYTALIETTFGYKKEVSGIWKGCSFFDLKIRQVDYHSTDSVLKEK